MTDTYDQSVVNQDTTTLPVPTPPPLMVHSDLTGTDEEKVCANNCLSNILSMLGSLGIENRSAILKIITDHEMNQQTPETAPPESNEVVIDLGKPESIGPTESAVPAGKPLPRFSPEAIAKLKRLAGI